MAPMSQIYGTSSSQMRLTGLGTGMDTNAIIDNLLMGSKNKIDREYQAKQTILYKQEAFRDVSTKLLDFQNKFFTYSGNSENNILSPSFFDASTFTSTSDSIAVSGNVENIKNFNINYVSSVASSASFSSSKNVVESQLTSGVLPATTSTLAGKSMTINHDGKDHVIKFSEDFGHDTPITGELIASEINSKLQEIEGIGNITASVSDGKLSVVADTGQVRLAGANLDVIEGLNLEVGKEIVSSEGIDLNSLTKSASDVLTSKDNYITLSLNGVNRMITMDETNTSPEETITNIQNQINSFYGEGRIEASLEDGKFTFKTLSNTSKLAITEVSQELGGLLGLKAGDSNRLNTNQKLEDVNIPGLIDQDTYELKINDVTFNITKDMTVKQITDEINRSDAGVRAVYSETTNTFSVSSKITGTNSRVDIEDVSGNLASSLFGESGVDYNVTAGTDTVINYTLNGDTREITRSTEDITIDGIIIDLNKSSVTNEAVTFTVQENTDKIVEKMEEFIKEYNEIIDLLGTSLKERPNRGYAPLTPAQRDAMNEKDIELWDKEAKKGMLFGDSKIRLLYERLRTTMSGLTGGLDSNSLSPHQVGIRTLSMDTTGKINLDKEKFKETLLQRPDELKEMFTSTTGIASKLVSAIRDNVGAYGTKGILIEEAGTADGYRKNDNFLSRRLEQHDKRMETLRQFMAKEEERYAKRFAAMEAAISKLDAQGAVFYDQMMF